MTRRISNATTVERYLAAFAIVSLAGGPSLLVQLGKETASIWVVQMIVLLMVFQYLISTLAGVEHASAISHRGMVLSLIPFSFLLLFPVFVADSIPSAAAAFVNFFSGVVVGYFIARAWVTADRTRVGIIDLAVTVFVLTAAVQIFSLFDAGTSLIGFHVAVELSWGESNYVAGVLVIASLAILGRCREIERPHIWMWLVAALGIVSAILTLGRSAIIALGIGMIVFLWHVGRTTFQRFAVRSVALISPIFILLILNGVNDARFTGNTVNMVSGVSSRFILFDLSWNEFLSSPIWGTGWVSLRTASLDGLGASISFAHNLFFSFLQIGGLLAVPVLILAVAPSIIAISSKHAFAGATAAALTISLFEPLFEGLVGAAVAFACLNYVLRTAGELSAQRLGVPVPVRGRTRLLLRGS